MRKPRTSKPALNLWLIDSRKELKLTPGDIARRLDIAESTVRGWEAGRSIGPDSITALEQLCGSEAPNGHGAEADLGSLVTAIGELVAELRLSRARQETFDEQMLALVAAALGTPPSPAAPRSGTAHATPAGTRQ